MVYTVCKKTHQSSWSTGRCPPRQKCETPPMSVLTEFILEMHGIIYFFLLKVPVLLALEKYTVFSDTWTALSLVPVVRSSVVTSGNTESSVSCNSGEEVICVDLKADKTFVQKYSQPHLQTLI